MNSNLFHCKLTKPHLWRILTADHSPDRPGPPGVPVVRNQVGTAVHLEWSPPSHPAPSSTVHNTLGGPPAAPIQIQGYTIEYREAGALWLLLLLLLSGCNLSLVYMFYKCIYTYFIVNINLSSITHFSHSYLITLFFCHML